MDSVQKQQETASEKQSSPTTRAKAVHPTCHPQQAMATDYDDDERLLAQNGYRQVFRREFTKWTTRSYAVSILGVLGSQPATYGIPISLGGPATAVWAWFVGSIMAFVIASCVAELVSAYPTAGGMYFVTKHVVPEKHVPIWAWIIGWCNFLGQAAGVASIAYTIAQMFLAAGAMNHSTFSPGPYVIVLVSISLLFLFSCICSLTTKGLNDIVRWFAPINIVATISIGIALLALTPDKRSASFVFTDVRDGSGWGSRGFSFLLGFLNVAWVMTDYDGTTHMAEETRDAAIEGPKAIRLAVIASGLLGWWLNIIFTFCLPENYMDEMDAYPSGLPFAQIFLNAGGPTGGTIMMFFVILVQFFTGVSALLANARMTYAFARDEALPFSGFWSHVSKGTSTPVRAVWLVFIFTSCLNLIGIGSTETITAIFNLCAPCLDLSYVAVLFAKLLYVDYLGVVEFIPGPESQSVGRFSKPMNILAIAWVLFISVVLFFPTNRPVTATNMNYAVIVAVFVALFSLGWWWAGARHKYTGPRTEELLAQIATEDDDDENLRQPDQLPPAYGTMKQQDVITSRESSPGAPQASHSSY